MLPRQWIEGMDRSSSSNRTWLFIQHNNFERQQSSSLLMFVHCDSSISVRWRHTVTSHTRRRLDEPARRLPGASETAVSSLARHTPRAVSQQQQQQQPCLSSSPHPRVFAVGGRSISSLALDGRRFHHDLVGQRTAPGQLACLSRDATYT